MLRINACAVIAYLVLVGVAPYTALAHATPVSYSPDAGSTALVAPEFITVHFTERIEAGASSLTVFSPDGSKINNGKGTLDENDPRLFTVPIDDAGEGVYTVSWQVVSVDDGHFTKGAFSFLVDAEGKAFQGSAEEATEVSYSSKLPEAGSSFLGLLGESIFLAALVLLLIITRRVPPELYASSQKLLTALSTHAVIVGALLFVGSGIAALLRKSMELSVLQETTLIEAIFTYTQSSVGTVAVLKILCALCFAAVFVANRKHLLTLPRVVIALLSVLLSAILVMQSYVSHAAASLFMPEFSIAITFVHLISKEFIIGGILAMVALAWALYEPAPKLLRSILMRFDRYASFALLLAAISGVYVTWLHLKSFGSLTNTEWGERFLVLLFAACFLGVFRLFHMLYLNPRIYERKKRRVLVLSLPGEAALGLLVLFLSGYIAITTPAFTVEQYTFSNAAVSEGVSIVLDVHPYEEDMLRLTFTDDQNGEPAQVLSTTLTTFNEAMNIGPNVIELHKRFEGGYVFPRAELAPAGEWEVVVNVAQAQGYDARATFRLMYPDAVLETRYSDEARTFDIFAQAMLMFGLLLGIFCVALILWSARNVLKDEGKQIEIEPDDFSSKQIIAGVAGALLVALVFTGVWQFGLITGFQMRCERDGFHWTQSFPARDFEATSKNAVVGCNVHEGHYHFADEREYDLFMKSAE